MKHYNFFLFVALALSKLTGAAPTTDHHDTQGALLSSTIADHALLEARQISTQDCRRGLNCGYDYIESQPMEWRLGYLRGIQTGYLTNYNSGTQCKAVEGNIAFMLELQLGSPKTWISGVNAGLIEAIQNGVAILIGLRVTDGGNPGAKYWAAFFRKQRSGGYANDRNKHDADWTTCEELSSEYGRQRSTQKGYRPTQRETNVYKTTQVYRYVCRNKESSSNIFTSILGSGSLSGSLSGVLSGGLSGGSSGGNLLGGLLSGVVGGVLSLVTGLLSWVTDITNVKSGYSFYKSCFSFLNLSGSASANLSITAIITGMLPSLLSFYKS
ncbi:hypothetical protein FB567DRAFT_586048 [Paraphoma chrysanthemicola]|uniref:Uncharacterized protein n=1 Tax=Paraphoma chrysanthemicola TaxID=798071 RepID=A0A8K0RJ28_9PLEO|nr:hypothetical protein FB567DRAFT_586048 [Paraphoma chrysanthemicola]